MFTSSCYHHDVSRELDEGGCTINYLVSTFHREIITHLPYLPTWSELPQACTSGRALSGKSPWRLQVPKKPHKNNQYQGFVDDHSFISLDHVIRFTLTNNILSDVKFCVICT